MWCHVTTCASSIEIEDSRARRASPDWDLCFHARTRVSTPDWCHVCPSSPSGGHRKWRLKQCHGGPFTKRVNDMMRRGTSTSRSATGPSWLLRKLKLQWHVKTVTMRAGSLTTTDVDFFKTLLDRHEETQSRMNALTPQLFLPVSAKVTTPKTAQAMSGASEYSAAHFGTVFTPAVPSAESVSQKRVGVRR